MPHECYCWHEAGGAMVRFYDQRGSADLEKKMAAYQVGTVV